MRIKLTYITPVLVAGAAAVAIAAAPTAAADPLPVQPAVIATAPTDVAGHFDHARYGGWGGGHPGGWGGGDRGGWGGGWNPGFGGGWGTGSL
ncbi:hypothetical protein [Rhodococcus sp. JVH1]|uniref:hypothetical protein n=1 Tax=Rhodococcus sp. JVH1 TaxID=745408 RepID=UPI000271E12A|nr:hypothetical protein [Rhodococcus sp. JVH1]EJI94372.1 DEAD-box ATP-dependent RNA helicase 30 domain protein [Rhodococcus sp. JVH1]